MAKATITIEDTPEGEQKITADFGDGLDANSGAHRLTAYLMQAVKEVHEGEGTPEWSKTAPAETEPA